MTDRAIKTLAARIVEGLAPMIESMAELRELRQIGEEPATDFFVISRLANSDEAPRL
jgi:hypothetical protein